MPSISVPGFVHQRLPTAGGDDIGPGFCEATRDRAPDSRRAADDHGHTATQIESLEHVNESVALSDSAG